MAILFAISGFVAGSGMAMASIVLATELTSGRTSREVRRPVIRILAAAYVIACGVAVALLAYDFA